MAKISIVDDSDEVRNTLRKELSDAGHEISEAEDGSIALDLCKKPTFFDLVVTDHNMPVMCGIDFVRALREDDRFRNTYVVFHTTESKDLLRSQGQGLGINGWMVKPVVPQNLRLLIDHVLKTRKTA